MPYQTGVSSSPANLIDLLATFLAANGWTIDESAGVGDTIERYVNDGANAFFSMETTASLLRVYPNTGYNVANDVDNQPGVPNPWGGARGRLNTITGPHTAYHFFLDTAAPDGDQCTVVLEQSPDVFRMFSFGTLEKFGTYDGGQYLAHDNHSVVSGPQQSTATAGCFGNDVGGGNVDQGVVRVGGLDGQGQDWMGQEGVIGHGFSDRRMMFSTGHSNQSAFPSLFFGTREVKATYSTFWPLNPVCVYINRPLNSGPTQDRYSVAGRIRNVYQINSRDFDPGQVIVIGTEDYLLFPQGRKTDDDTNGEAPNAHRKAFVINRDM